MAVVATRPAREQARPPATHPAVYEPTGCGQGVLTLNDCDKRPSYTVREIAADPEHGPKSRAFRLRKRDGEIYTVQVHDTDPAQSTCECGDSLWRKRECKHVRGLRYAIESGQVDCEVPDDYEHDPREYADELPEMWEQYHGGGGPDPELTADSLPAATVPVPTAGRKEPPAVVGTIACPGCHGLADVVAARRGKATLALVCRACEAEGGGW